MATSMFEVGKFTFDVYEIKKTHASSPPKPLMIVAPCEEGEYPVMVFLPGSALDRSFYTQLLTHISSHGYIIVAPQLYSLIPPSSGQVDIDITCEVTNWLPQGLQSVLPKTIHPNLLKLVLLGHSRGGQTAFSLALGFGKTSVPFTALIGIGPVAGRRKGHQIDPQILTYKPQSFNLGIPVMVIGTGLGDKTKTCSPCAPDGVSHEEFYNECKPPCYHFVTKEYGHMDMLDDQLKIVGKIASCLCKKGEGDKDLMRRCVGGLVVAFARDCLDGQSLYLKAIIDDPSLAPTTLDPVEFR